MHSKGEYFGLYHLDARTNFQLVENIVLAGIGKLIVVDQDIVAEEDLGAGFFFTEEDVGKNVGIVHVGQSTSVQNSRFTLKRADSARTRIQNLNPLVTVDTLTTFDSLIGVELGRLVKSADLLCVTDLGTEWIVGPTDQCEKNCHMANSSIQEPSE